MAGTAALEAENLGKALHEALKSHDSIMEMDLHEKTRLVVESRHLVKIQWIATAVKHHLKLALMETVRETFRGRKALKFQIVDTYKEKPVLDLEDLIEAMLSLISPATNVNALKDDNWITGFSSHFDGLTKLVCGDWEPNELDLGAAMNNSPSFEQWLTRMVTTRCLQKDLFRVPEDPVPRWRESKEAVYLDEMTEEQRKQYEEDNDGTINLGTYSEGTSHWLPKDINVPTWQR